MVISIKTEESGKTFFYPSYYSSFPIRALSAQDVSPRYEFRGAWIATVDNIDWPSRKGLPVDSQKAEYHHVCSNCIKQMV